MGFPVGKHRRGALRLTAELSAALGPRQPLQHHLGCKLGSELTTMCHVTFPLWTYCTVVSWWSKSWGSLQLHQLAVERVWMHRIPERVSITADVLGQSAGHRWGAWPTLLAHAALGQHKGVEVDYQPDPRAVS